MGSKLRRIREGGPEIYLIRNGLIERRVQRLPLIRPTQSASQSVHRQRANPKVALGIILF